MPQNQAANNFATTLGAPISSTSATTMTLASSTNEPVFPYLATLLSSGASGPPFAKIEIVQVTGVSSGLVRNIVRAQEGTTAQTWSSGDTVGNDYTAGAANRLMQATWQPDWGLMVSPLLNPFQQATMAGSGSGGSASNEPFGGTVYSGATANSNFNVRLYDIVAPPGNLFSQAVGNGIGLLLWLNQVTQPVNSGDVLEVTFGNVTLEILPSGVLKLFTPTLGATTLTATMNDTNAHVVLVHMRPGGLYDFWLDGTKTDSIADGTNVTPSSPPLVFYAANGSASTTNVKMAVWGFKILQGVAL